MNLSMMRLHHRDQLPHAATAKTSCFLLCGETYNVLINHLSLGKDNKNNTNS